MNNQSGDAMLCCCCRVRDGRGYSTYQQLSNVGTLEFAESIGFTNILVFVVVDGAQAVHVAMAR